MVYLNKSMDYTTDEKPQLVPTDRGFSVLYRNKYLYSKYAPSRTLIARAEVFDIPASCVLLCFSPVLGYGLQELMAKLPADSFLLAIECDQSLMRFSLDNCDAALFTHPRFSYIRTQTLSEVMQKIESLPLFPFKKCVNFACSGGVQLYQDFYDQVGRYAEELISRFWINRLTLIHLGRNYAHNTFRNLNFLQKNTHCSILKGTERIKKPILVVGAGTSLDDTRDFIMRNRNRFILFAVDAAAAALMSNIKPDAIILVESQYWIDSAFVGCKKTGIPVFADLTASPRAIRANGGNIYFFCTDYARLRYLQPLYRVLQPLIVPPMGSVGLTALRLALDLSEPNIPILHTGLDFAWGCGLTHAAESGPIKKLFAETHRTESLYKLNFPAGAQPAIGKQNRAYWTSPVLTGYAELYRHAFGAESRLIDIGTFGFRLTDRHIGEAEAEDLLTAKTVKDNDTGMSGFAASFKFDSAVPDIHQSVFAEKERIRRYLTTEFTQLSALEAHLQGEKALPQDVMEGIIAERDYLYAHFPDAARGYSLDISFLKRLRIELSYMLKILSQIE